MPFGTVVQQLCLVVILRFESSTIGTGEIRLHSVIPLSMKYLEDDFSIGFEAVRSVPGGE